MVGLTFGHLTVEAPAGSNRAGQALWYCACKCGSQRVVAGSELRRGRAESCGCLAKDRRAASKKYHPLYAVWNGMHARCRDPRRADYHLYGGRGVRVCPGWEVFEQFVADMSPRPHGATLDREDNDAGYSPDNCRWATPTQQAHNRRTTRPVVYRGAEMPVTAACRSIGVCRGAYLFYTRRGLTPQEAVDLLENKHAKEST